MIQIAETTIDQALTSGLESLAFDHWLESSPFAGSVPFRPNWTYYRAMERMGYFKMLGVFEVSSILVGYASFIISPDPWTGQLHAVEDAIYVDPADRGVAGFLLLRKVDEWLKDQGVAVNRYRPSIGSALCDLLPKLGYKQVEHSYAKVM